jgi:predicted transcriptional regulator
MAAGWNAIPNIIIEKQQALGLSPLDMNIILYLSSFWWEEKRLPFPSVDTIAKAVGVVKRTVQKRMAALEKAGLMQRIEWKLSKGGSDTNCYSFAGLIKEATPFAEEKLKQRAENEAREKERLGRKKPKLTVIDGDAKK